MKFLVDEDLPRSVTDLFRRYGHEAVRIRDVGLRGAKDVQIAAYAQENRLCLVTGDFDFADIRNYPPPDYSGIVVLVIQRDATAHTILKLSNGLLEQKELVLDLQGKLAIIEPGRIRIRKS